MSSKDSNQIKENKKLIYPNKQANPNNLKLENPQLFNN